MIPKELRIHVFVLAGLALLAAVEGADIDRAALAAMAIFALSMADGMASS